MKNSITDKKFNRIVQAIPMVVFLLFTIYYFANGNVELCGSCRGLESFGNEIMLIFITGGTIIIYSLIYLLSLLFYSKKFNYLAILSLFIFSYGTSDLEFHPSKKRYHKMVTKNYKNEIELLDNKIKCQPDFYLHRKLKSIELTKLAGHSNDTSLFYVAIEELENFQKHFPGYDVDNDIRRVRKRLERHTRMYSR